MSTYAAVNNLQVLKREMGQVGSAADVLHVF